MGKLLALRWFMSIATLDPVLDRLADFESDTNPVVSLYLDLRADSRGKDAYRAFLDGALKEQLESYGPDDPARASLERSVERIREYLKAELEPSAAALAIFASSGEDDLFEALQLEAPIDGHRLYVDREPHVFPLARLADQHASYAALLVNTNSARLYVFAAGAAQQQMTVRNKKGRRVSKGGWSQARYQRRTENLHLKHMKEVASALEALVRDEGIERVLVAGDEVALPRLRDELPAQISERLVEVGGLDLKTPEDEVLTVTLDAFRDADAQSDQERVNELLDAYRSRGLGTISVAGVKAALERGQVDRLLVPATPSTSAAARSSSDVESGAPKEATSDLDEQTIEELVTLARRTDASITFIEDARLLEPARGVGALLRYRI